MPNSSEKQKFKRFSEIFTATISMLVVVSSVLVLTFIRVTQTEFKSKKEDVIVGVRLGAIEQKIEQVEQQIKQSDNVELTYLNNQIEKLRSEVSAVKQLILDDPEAMLTLPLVKKDIDVINKDILNVRSEINRLFNFSKWFLGTQITLSLGLFSVVIAGILKK